MENLYSLVEAAQKQKTGVSRAWQAPGTSRLRPVGLGPRRCLQSHHFVLELTLPVTVENGGFFLQWRMSACSHDRKGLCSAAFSVSVFPTF